MSLSLTNQILILFITKQHFQSMISILSFKCCKTFLMNFWLQALTFVWWLCFVVYFALYLVHYGCILVKFLTYLWLFSFYHLEYFYCHVQSGQAYQSTIIGKDIRITKQMHMQQWFNNYTTYVKVPTDIDFFHGFMII